MTTIINTPPAGESADSGAGMILGAILVLVLVSAFFVYAVPFRRAAVVAPQDRTVDINVKLPNPTPSTINPTSATQ